MNITQLEEKQIYGISVRTGNADEMNPDTAKIGPLCRRFDENVSVDYQGGARVYSVYFDYESDASGVYTVLVGADRAASASLPLETVTIAAGRYLVFEGSGEVPQMVIDTWMRIWDYFASDDAQYERAYTTDFEYYKGPNDVEIYIAIK